MNDFLAGNDEELAAKRRGWGLYASHIGPNGTYMERWILRLPFGFTIRLHHILRSDEDRDLHDHPFDFTSFLLSGGYVETVPCHECDGYGQVEVPGTGDGDRDAAECTACRSTGHARRVWPRFAIVRKRAEHLHFLTLERPVWTLVFAGPKRREWGFDTEEGWVNNHEYGKRWPERVQKV